MSTKKPIYVKGTFISDEQTFLNEILCNNYGFAKVLSEKLGISQGMIGHYKSGAARMRPSLFKEILNCINDELGTDYNQQNFNLLEKKPVIKKSVELSISDKKVEYLINDFLSTTPLIKAKFLISVYPTIFSVDNYSELLSFGELTELIDKYNSM